MGDIVIIHAADARDFACRAASQLAAEGHAVRRSCGAAPPADADTDAVLVVWSRDLAAAAPPNEEARQALARRALVPIAIGAAEPPPAFAHLWPIDLSGWEGDASDPRWQFVRDEIKLARLRGAARAAPARPREPGAAPRRADGGRSRNMLLTRMIPPAAAAAAVFSAAAVLMATPREPPIRRETPPVAAPTAVAAALPTTEEGVGELSVIAAAPEDAAGTIESVDLVAQLLEEAPQSSPESQAAPESAAPVEAETGGAIAAGPDAEAGEIDDPAMAAEFAQAPAPSAADETAALAPLPLPPPAPDDYRGAVFRDCVDCPDMAEIPAGAFDMGASLDDAGAVATETPVRRVTITKSFAMSRREITFAQWDACVAGGGCRAYSPPDAGWGRGQRPVIHVSWDDAQGYVAWLSARTGQPYRLPSEAEWEYAARASANAVRSTDGALSPMLANYEDGARASTAPAASFAPSEFGLYDMLGNVWEWVADCWRDGHADAPSDGSAIAGDCGARVLKGGAFNSSAWRLRPAHRIAKRHDAREPDNGFRVARDLS